MDASYENKLIHERERIFEVTRQQWLLLGVGGAILAYLYYNRSSVSSAAQSGVEALTAATEGWQSVDEGPTWVPVINQTEAALGIPANLLARMAYQESHFRPEIINGTLPSPAGALGILQLMPQYFSTVQRPTPFSTQDTLDQINQAGQLLVSLYNQFQDWTLAIAAYNDGAGNIEKYLSGQGSLPNETQNYVADVVADVPVPGALA